MAAAALLVSMSLFSLHAFAATSGTTIITVGIQSGGLSITAPTVSSDFGNVTLSSSVQKPTAQLSTLSVIDATGTGAGFKVNVQATQFTEVTPGGGFAGASTAKTLPTSSLKLAPPSTISAVGGTLSPKPAATIAALTVIDGGAPVKVLSAAVGNGMGSYDIAFPAASLELTIDPATAQVDTLNYNGVATPYSSTITWSIVTGP
jgi:hypothetical protein